MRSGIFIYVLNITPVQYLIHVYLSIIFFSYFASALQIILLLDQYFSHDAVADLYN